MSKSKNILRFKGYSNLFHYIASSEYDSTKTLATNNGKVYCVSLARHSNTVLVFFLGILVAVVNKDLETVRSLPKWTLGQGLDYVLYSLRNAFDHYTKIEISFLEGITSKMLLDSHKGKEFPSNLTFVRSVKTLLDTISDAGLDTSVLTGVHKSINDIRERERKAKEERERIEAERKAKKDAEIEALTPFFKNLFSQWTTDFIKLKNFNKLYYYKLKDIPKKYREHFEKDSWNNNPLTEETYVRSKYSTKYDYSNLLNIRRVDKYHSHDGSTYLPDGITLVGKTLLTTQGCEVDITTPGFITLFKKLMKCIKEEKDCSEYYGNAIGSYQLRLVDYEDNFIRVGCHFFLIEDVLGLEKDILNAYNLYQS